MVEKRKPQKTRYQGVAYVAEGNFCRGFGSPGSGLCVSAAGEHCVELKLL